MKSALYTGTGDSGTTSLTDGSRIRKDSTRLEAYGTVDEFSSFVGVVICHKDCPEIIRKHLTQVQTELFYIGALLATPEKEGEKQELPALEKRIPDLEHWIDELDEHTPKIRTFVLPGGSELSAHCHVARTVCRRAERRIISLGAESYVSPLILTYFNRLSDYLFIAARYVNHLLGVEELLWQPTK